MGSPITNARVRNRATAGNFFRGWPLFFIFPLVTFGQPAASPPPAAQVPANPASRKSDYSGWVFSFLPTAFQKNPVLYQTVITEATDLGRKLPPVSPQTPAYYVAYTAGPLEGGDVSGGRKPLSPERVRSLLARSLAEAGYLPAKLPSQPPTLLIIYSWGSYNKLSDDTQAAVMNFYTRAALVGGEQYVKQVEQLRSDYENLRMFNSSSHPVLTQGAIDFFDPINRYKSRDPRNEFLWDQASGELYFVIASAYDYQSAAANQRKLIWRTRMTVSSAGVSEEQSLPKLILGAAPFFGKDMAEPEVLIKRALPEVEINIGTPEVIEMPAKEETPGKGRKP